MFSYIKFLLTRVYNYIWYNFKWLKFIRNWGISGCFSMFSHFKWIGCLRKTHCESSFVKMIDTVLAELFPSRFVLHCVLCLNDWIFDWFFVLKRKEGEKLNLTPSTILVVSPLCYFSENLKKKFTHFFIL